ncbi:hypothetical protein FGE12_06565 [Aggregicoccus sp. 17bor-14]|uniref:hypothetical protein n=1 Tax=Myxococcaceae TaxID=31 RepID=UPI00129C69E5|nr:MULTISPECIES: hypothetical protein [Myxococcaceae]MBF5042051.1 hypothetical protein [Simulacricoccus sp. 17bor-14]MRI87829.1 hypothetical protein [Aggregicoccus sp. 17bor-14]
MRASSLILIALLALPALAAAPPKPGYRVHDFTPTFWRYWDEAKDKPQAEQVRLFEERVVRAHPEVYNATVLTLEKDKPLGPQLAERWPRAMAFVGPHLDVARMLSGRVGKDLPRYDARFRKAFPDFAYTGDVYFLVSMGAFDGATRQVNGRTALLFGTDVMAAVYGAEANPESFFDHELFHIYHEQFPDPALEDTLAQKLWHEGLAVYVADTLNPGTPEAILFGLPRDMPARSRANLPALAAQLRAKLDSKEQGDYERWFMKKSEDPVVPPRAGYFLGYLVAKELGRTRSLRELARLRGPALRKELDRVLRQLEQTPAAAAPAAK